MIHDGAFNIDHYWNYMYPKEAGLLILFMKKWDCTPWISITLNYLYRVFHSHQHDHFAAILISALLAEDLDLVVQLLNDVADDLGDWDPSGDDAPDISSSISDKDYRGFSWEWRELVPRRVDFAMVRAVTHMERTKGFPDYCEGGVSSDRSRDIRDLLSQAF
jgi:hypothetical protein